MDFRICFFKACVPCLVFTLCASNTWSAEPHRWDFLSAMPEACRKFFTESAEESKMEKQSFDYPIEILEPKEGSVVEPGHIVTVRVAPPESVPTCGVVVALVGAFTNRGWGSGTSNKATVKAPMQLGSYKLRVFGFDAAGRTFFAERIILVETGRELAELKANLRRFKFKFPGEQARLDVTGVLRDGTRLEITDSTKTTYKSENTGVVTVDAAGLVTAVGAGTTNIVVSYGGRAIALPVAVPKTIRGDLNADGKLNREDLGWLLSFLGVLATDDWTNIPDSKFRQATGPFDARDLNGDGVINAQDVTILVNLIGAIADLVVAHEVFPNPVTVGSPFTYTITVTNNGPDAVPYVAVRGNLPKVKFVSSTVSGGHRRCGVMYNHVTCNFGTLERHASIKADVVVIPEVAGTFAVVVRASSSIPDPNQINDTAVIRINIMDDQAPTPKGP